MYSHSKKLIARLLLLSLLLESCYNLQIPAIPQTKPRPNQETTIQQAKLLKQPRQSSSRQSLLINPVQSPVTSSVKGLNQGPKPAKALLLAMLKAKQSLTDATLGKQYRPYINPAPISPRNLSIANQFQASSQPNKLHADFQHLPSNTSTLQEQKALSKYQQATQARRMQQGLEKAPALNPIDLPTPPPGKSLQDMQSQPFLAKGGHRVAFM